MHFEIYGYQVCSYGPRSGLLSSVAGSCVDSRRHNHRVLTAAANPNATASANTGAYGSDANVSVGYSAYTYSYGDYYGGLGNGSGGAIYSDDSPYSEAMTFFADPGYTVTLNSFDLAQYYTSNCVSISVTGGTSSYSLTSTPAGGDGFTFYSPNITGTALSLTITNLYDVGLNEITYSETQATSTPEPSTVLLATMSGAIFLTENLVVYGRTGTASTRSELFPFSAPPITSRCLPSETIRCANRGLAAPTFSQLFRRTSNPYTVPSATLT